MGGRGTFASGNSVAYSYETVGKIAGVKVLQPRDSSSSLKLPEEAHSSGAYLLLDKSGVFRQYREYNDRHEVILEIGYHNEPALGYGKILHAHIHTMPGIINHGSAEKIKLLPGDGLYEKYKHLFIGVSDERQ